MKEQKPQISDSIIKAIARIIKNDPNLMYPVNENKESFVKIAVADFEITSSTNTMSEVATQIQTLINDNKNFSDNRNKQIRNFQNGYT